MPKQLPGEFQTVETRCGKEGHTRLSRPQHQEKQERHNVTVITVGLKYEIYVRSPAPSHMQTLNNPFEPCNKLRGKYVVKEVFMRLPSCVFIMRRLFMRLSLMLCRCDAEWWCRWLYNTFLFLLNDFYNLYKESFKILNCCRVYKHFVFV